LHWKTALAVPGRMFIGAGEKHIAGFSSVNIQAEKDIAAIQRTANSTHNAGGLRCSWRDCTDRRSPEHRQCDWKNKYRALARRAADGSRHRAENSRLAERKSATAV
jgi:hypothetical protein